MDTGKTFVNTALKAPAIIDFSRGMQNKLSHVSLKAIPSERPFCDPAAFKDDERNTDDLAELIHQNLVLLTPNLSQLPKILGRFPRSLWSDADIMFNEVKTTHNIIMGAMFPTLNDSTISNIDIFEGIYINNPGLDNVRVMNFLNSPSYLGLDTEGRIKIKEKLGLLTNLVAIRAHFFSPDNTYIKQLMTDKNISGNKYSLSVSMIIQRLLYYFGSKPVHYKLDNEGGFVLDWVSDLKLKKFMEKTRIYPYALP